MSKRQNLFEGKGGQNSDNQGSSFAGGEGSGRDSSDNSFAKKGGKSTR